MRIEWLLAGITAVCLIIIGTLAYSWINREKVETDVRVLPGRTDTVFVEGLPDTVLLTKWNTKVVRVLQPVGLKDSSRVDTVLRAGSDSLRFGVTTFPEVDSLRIEAGWITSVREIYKVDTLRLFRRDTLLTVKKIEVAAPLPFYEDGWFYSTVGAVGVIALLIFGGK